MHAMASHARVARLLHQDIDGGFPFRVRRRFPSKQFSFCFYLNLNCDGFVEAADYGREESSCDRLPLRACMLASGGNTLVAEWGIPSDYRIDWHKAKPQAELAERYDVDYYLYNAHPFPNRIPWRPVTLLLRNGNYLPFVSAEENRLPEEILRRVARGVEGNELDAEQIRRARRITAWDMFYPIDTWRTKYHRVRYSSWIPLRRHEPLADYYE